MKKFLLLALTFAFAAPAFAGIAVIGNLARHHQVKPGAVFEGIILVRNTGTESVDVRVAQNDYTFAADGSNHYEKPGTHPRSNASWLSTSPSRLTIEPRGTASIYYKGRVPNSGAELNGTFWSLLMIEPLAAPPARLSGQSEKLEMGVQTVMRFAVQIVTDLPQPGRDELKVIHRSLATGEGRKALQLDVANPGDRVQIPALAAELYNAEGVSIGRFDGGKWRIYPTCSVRYNVDLTDIPAGRYTALIILDTGGDYVTGAQYTLEIP